MLVEVLRPLGPLPLRGGGVLKVGSLCTGIGGLELGLSYAGVEAEVMFVSDIDRRAVRWLRAAMPDVPNLGDFTDPVAAGDVPTVDLVTAGFPCQPFSHLGRQRGIDDERWLFDDIAKFLTRVGRPDVFLENVPALLSANRGHAMRRVVVGLAELGYRIVWGVLGASDVGACHRRRRWFCYGTSSVDVDGKKRFGIQDGPAIPEVQRVGNHPPTGGSEFPWGQYGPVIDRWAAIVGRPPPTLW